MIGGSLSRFGFVLETLRSIFLSFTTDNSTSYSRFSFNFWLYFFSVIVKSYTYLSKDFSV